MPISLDHALVHVERSNAFAVETSNVKETFNSHL